MRFLLPLTVCLAAVALGRCEDPYVLVGTNTGDESQGIHVYRFDVETGALAPVGGVDGIGNPSFVTVSPCGKFVYAVSEAGGGAVAAWRFDEARGTLTLLNTQPSGGASPCHLSLDRTGRFLLVGNYGGGNFRSFPVGPDGSLGPPGQTLQHSGQGADPVRQQAPHVHSVNLTPNNRDLFVLDLGTDQVMVYRFDPASGRISEGSPASVATAPGAGPRHLAFHPHGGFVYVINELNSTITAYVHADGTLREFQTVPTLPPEFEGKNFPADIHVSGDGKFLYGSNRGHNSLVVYRIDKVTGRLALAGHHVLRGRTPRNFAIDPSDNFILVANQDSNTIEVLRRNPETGLLTDTGQETGVRKPACVIFR